MRPVRASEWDQLTLLKKKLYYFLNIIYYKYNFNLIKINNFFLNFINSTILILLNINFDSFKSIEHLFLLCPRPDLYIKFNF